MMNVKLNMSTADHHQTDGQSEFNKTFLQYEQICDTEFERGLGLSSSRA